MEKNQEKSQEKSIKNGLLDEQEFKMITKAHDEFDKTPFGKKTKTLMLVIVVFGIVFLALSGMCAIVGVVSDKSYYAYAVFSALLFFVNVSLLMVSQIIYESMVMNYINFKK